MSRPCTCQSPPTVDLTDSFVRRRNSSSSSVEARQNEPDDDADDIRQQRLLLLHNLKVYGWSMVQLDVSKIARNDPVCEILRHHRQWKDMLVDLFENNNDNNRLVHDDDDDEKVAIIPECLTYRSAESGAPGGTAVEPKQSWEIKRCSHGRGERSQQHHRQCASSLSCPQQSMIAHYDECIMDSWANVLHAVAVTVRQMLNLPPGLLLQEQPCCCCRRRPENNNNNPHGGCSIDLMRAFYYDTVKVKSRQQQQQQATTDAADANADAAINNNITTATTMGSSPHTDWGSFTVVYQDHVKGCLQTFCHGCQKWVDVPTKTTTTTTTTSAAIEEEDLSLSADDFGVVRFVVHVGDVTSLAIGRALQTSHQHQDLPIPSAATTTSVPVGSSTYHRVVFPSPRHRVLSPTNEKRGSLVYFAYPPPEYSISAIAQGLESWCTAEEEIIMSEPSGSSSIQDIILPYDDYYLLQNQAANNEEKNHTGTSRRRSAKEQYQAIADFPLRDVLKDKWEQVQR